MTQSGFFLSSALRSTGQSVLVSAGVPPFTPSFVVKVYKRIDSFIIIIIPSLPNKQQFPGSIHPVCVDSLNFPRPTLFLHAI